MPFLNSSHVYSGISRTSPSAHEALVGDVGFAPSGMHTSSAHSFAAGFPIGLRHGIPYSRSYPYQYDGLAFLADALPVGASLTSSSTTSSSSMLSLSTSSESKSRSRNHVAVDFLTTACDTWRNIALNCRATCCDHVSTSFGATFHPGCCAANRFSWMSARALTSVLCEKDMFGATRRIERSISLCATMRSGLIASVRFFGYVMKLGLTAYGCSASIATVRGARVLLALLEAIFET